MIDDAVMLAKRFEGLRLRPYLCAAGVATIGYGATYYEDGTRVTLSDPPITRERAEQLLMWMLEREYLPAAMKLCPNVTPTKTAALADFAFNLGIARLKHSTLRRKINAGDYDGAEDEFMKWVYAGGKKLRGLIARRQAEVLLFRRD